jgi:hypothetical protein
MSSMSVKTFVEVARKLPIEASILLRGPHGIGKSQVVRQVARLIAQDNGITNFELIDRRLSQMSEGDMIGLPSTDGEVTRFNPPDWYKRACMKPCVLFLDELNRATPEVMQAAFQIVLDRELNGLRLHPQTRVFSAINSSAAYTVNEMDPALLDRFWTIDLEPTVEDWMAWARKPSDQEGGEIHSTIIDFIQSNEKWLDVPGDSGPGEVTPSRRSWERLSIALTGAEIADEPDAGLFYPMTLGYVGANATIAFVAFAKTIDNQVSGKEIIEGYEKVKKKIAKLGQEKLNVCSEKVSDYVTQKAKALNEDQGKNLAAFMRDLPGELAVALWSKLTQGSGATNLELAKAVHHHCVDIILDVFGSTPEAIAKALETANKKAEEKAKADEEKVKADEEKAKADASVSAKKGSKKTK